MHTYGAQALPRHRFLFLFSFSFLVLLWLLSLSVACCSLDVRAAYTAVYDRYSSQSATFLFFFARSADNLLLRMFSPSLRGCVCLCSRPQLSLTFPRLLVPRLGLNSHSHRSSTPLRIRRGLCPLGVQMPRAMQQTIQSLPNFQNKPPTDATFMNRCKIGPN